MTKSHDPGNDPGRQQPDSSSPTPEGDQRLADFIRENQLSFPAAKVTRDPDIYFDITGTPSAAAIKDGRVVFAGSLSLITDEFMDNLVK